MSIFHEKISEKKYNPNPWAVCHITVDKEEDPDKYERCIRKVKEKSNVKKTKNAAKITGYSTKLAFEDEVKIYNKKKS